MRTPFVIALTLGLILLPGCSTSPNTAAGERALDDECQYAINDFKRVKGLEGFFAESAAYAVFPGVGKGGFIVGAAYGDGQLYQGGEAVGYCSLSQATVGLQIGGQKYRELIFFRSPASVRMFKQGRFELSAQASAVAVAVGASTTADYSHGVAVFTMSKVGLMVEASIGGQRFSYVTR